jgi:hypothetical protein
VLCKGADEQKRKALTSREQTSRAFFAKSALMWAIASDSPAFYGETVLWARRFVRDPVSSVLWKVYRHERVVPVSCASSCSLDFCDERLDPIYLSFPFFFPSRGISSLPPAIFVTGLNCDAFSLHSVVTAFQRKNETQMLLRCHSYLMIRI